MAEPVTEFVAGWNVVQILGEGAFGEVKLLINHAIGEAVAMKVVDLGKHPDAAEAVRKEICVHRMLKHQNVVKFFGSRKESCVQYMFLEYAAGGELFDRIEPDIGMPVADAQKFFRELIAGVEYLHSKGITHRDLKPENLLLDANDQLKISDFGMATLFRFNGKERELCSRCGTKPYMAPEVLLKPYNAQPADIWSCGVILVAMLAGELPWDEPAFSCKEFVVWKDKDCSVLSMSPWCKIDNLVLALLRKVLNSVPRRRATLESIKAHQWFNKKMTKSSDIIGSPLSSSTKRMRSEIDPHNSLCAEDHATRLVCSQPHMGTTTSSNDEVDFGPEKLQLYSFSQPAKPDQLLLSTQSLGGTQTSQGPPLQRLVKRMTRIIVRTSLEDTLTHLEAVFSEMSYTFRKHSPNVITVTTVDRRGSQLVLKASVLDMGHHILVDFRLSKGCGLDFKRHFLKIRDGLSHIIIKGPVTWSFALANNMLPT